MCEGCCQVGGNLLFFGDDEGGEGEECEDDAVGRSPVLYAWY